ncbi:hypothetical protein ONZ43_g4841 [Nemania bipapillata]|uniref:Uncharacterized protein n=1 Tax=Nemania bipapillata TaxID=110536 RepID=A0ACC2IHL8_9PEZI|nr:hypothetical protein ONZ43_g4841 [Nemania bipapillata]
MSTSSLSHLLQSNGTAEPNLSAGTQERGQNAPSGGPPYSQVQGRQVAIPQPPPPPPPAPTPAPVAHTSINPVSASPGGTYLQRGTSAPTPSDQSHLMTSSLYQCADCKKRYSRPEHLARHIQTHTLGKRFCCQVCGKAFARADLLKRHAANHDTSGDGTKKRRRIDASPGSGRVSHACRPCAAARVKCEEIKPCQRCQKKGLTCEYAATEAGSVAAMHLLHLSADAHNITPAASASPHSSQFSPAASQDQRPIPLGITSSAVHETRDTMSSNMDIKPEQVQPRTPDGIVDQGHYAYDNTYTTNNTADMTHQPFSDFLRDVLYAQSLDSSRLAEAQGLAVLDFCDDTSYELNEMDFGMLDHWNLDGMSERAVVTQAVTPKTDDSSVDMAQMRRKLVKIWTDSPWRWIPDKRDHSHGEYANLPLPCRDSASQQFRERQRQIDRVVPDKLDSSSRDKILTVVLGACNSDAIRMRVAASFPSAEIMDSLMHIFLAAHLCSVSSWIHFGTLKLNSLWPEWLATAAAAGATMTPVPTLRKFGFAIQEAVRLVLPSKFEENNTGIANLGQVQTLVLGQDISLWSGNRRKMEIAECHLLIPITMMRYRGRFQRSSYPAITVSESDQGEVLEEKWRSWYEAESWKRLAFHCYTRDTQASMTTLASPTMSYAELTLPLPESKELWFAKTAVEWKHEYLVRFAGQTKRPPCLGDLLRDINLLTANFQRLDTQYAISIYLHAFWNLIFEWRQLSAVHRSNPFQNSYPTGPNLILNSRHEELCKALSNFQLVTADRQASFSAQEALLLNLILMNLHVSLDDLQLFAGKEGEDQARRVYPILQHWSESKEARQSLFHAGQILRQAKRFPSGHLKQFYAVGVHHAALALWTYGVVTRATRNQPSIDMSQGLVYIDGPESTEVGRFVQFGNGRPMIRGVRCDDGQTIESGLEDPRLCMEISEEILRMNFNTDQDLLPPIVENLCHLIKQLGGAAWAVGLG